MTQESIPLCPQELDLPVPVCVVFREIERDTMLTLDFKDEWIHAIIDIFGDGIEFSKQSFEDKVTEAKKRLSKAMEFRTELDMKNTETERRNNVIISSFEKRLKSHN